MKPLGFEPKIIVIGASAGGGVLLREILCALPSDFPIPIAVVLHWPPHSENIAPKLLAHSCKLKVKEAEDKEMIQPETVYFAPSGYHLAVEPGSYFSLSIDPPLNFSIPSIDVLFESAAHVFKKHCLGILLSGANHDGAEGMRRIIQVGGYGIVQDPKEAEFDIMPKAALNETTPQQILSCHEILQTLKSLEVRS